MSDSIKAWHEMEDSEKSAVNHANNISKRHFIWVLDHETGTVHLYNIKRSDLGVSDCEKLIELHGHKLKSCHWMITERDKIYK
tara:strand:+ start:714 stop:962 length:249 start_codon:yes stop_codon:yes gene_type:complete